MRNIIDGVSVTDPTARAATPAEAEQILSVVTRRYTKSIRIGIRLTVALVVFAVLAFFSCISIASPYGPKPITPITFVPSLIVLAGAGYALYGVAHDAGVRESVEKGAYLVLDGTVCEIGSNSDRPGIVMVRFKANSGYVLPNWVPVDREDAVQGTELLLIYVPKYSSKTPVPGVISRRVLNEAQKIERR